MCLTTNMHLRYSTKLGSIDNVSGLLPKIVWQKIFVELSALDSKLNSPCMYEWKDTGLYQIKPQSIKGCYSGLVYDLWAC